MITKNFKSNPLLKNNLFIPDVEAHVFEDRLYLYGTYHGGLNNKPEYPMVHVYSTDDFINYEDHGVVFSSKDIKWVEPREIWAPDCVLRNGKYYLYYCIPDGVGCGVAVSDKPYGPFKDLGHIEGVYGIDPAVLVDDDGQAYLYYGQFDNVRVAKLKENMCEIIPESIVQPLSVKEHEYHEGISVRKINNKYYLTYTDTHRHGNLPTAQGYAVSDNPTEGFVYKNIIVDNFGCDPHTWNNHGSIECFKGQWYIFYHRAVADNNVTRQLCAEPIEFDKNGNIKEVEITSSGVGRTISASEKIPGCLACLVNGNVRIDYDEESDYELALCKIKGFDSATFRYIEFNGESNFKLTMKSDTDCRVEIYVDNVYHESVIVKASEQYKNTEKSMKGLFGTHSITLKFYGIDKYTSRTPLNNASLDEIAFFK